MSNEQEKACEARAEEAGQEAQVTACQTRPAEQTERARDDSGIQDISEEREAEERPEETQRSKEGGRNKEGRGGEREDGGNDSGNGNKVVTKPTDHARAARLEKMKAVCQYASQGMAIRKICAQDGMPDIGTVLTWCAEDAEMQAMYVAALRMRAAGLAEDLVGHCEELADGEVSATRVQALKVVIQTKQWTMSKLLPKLYGEMQTIEHTGEVKMDEKQIDARLAHLIERIQAIK